MKVQNHNDERGVSPVIGVILMVAITVILAAVIATFVLDLGTGVQEDAQAGVTVDGTDVTVTSMGNADAVFLVDDDGCMNDEVTSSTGATLDGTNANAVVASIGPAGADDCSALSDAEVNTTIQTLD